MWSQEIPNEFYQFQLQKLHNDAGKNWSKNTTFGPIRFNHDERPNDDSLHNQTCFGLNSMNDGLAIYAYSHFTFKSQFHGYLYPRIVNKTERFDRYSGVPRDIKRGGLSSGETDLSGIDQPSSSGSPHRRLESRGAHRRTTPNLSATSRIGH